MQYPHTNFKHDFIYSENERRSGSACLFKSSKSIKKIGRRASPNFNEEKKLWNMGYRFVVGLDEAGRGPLAGPVVAAAVVIKLKVLDANRRTPRRVASQKLKVLESVKDSKKLSPQKREKLYKILIDNKNIEWGIGRVSEKIIDKINIKNAAELAMWRAVKKLKTRPDFLIIDGNRLKNNKLKTINYKLIIKGDEKVFSVAAASIIAKVTRDRIMLKYDKKYPQYGFDKHKGYPTKYHKKTLKKYGPCLIHRKTFQPVRELLSKPS